MVCPQATVIALQTALDLAGKLPIADALVLDGSQHFVKTKY
jgi:hypothetical protein